MSVNSSRAGLLPSGGDAGAHPTGSRATGPARSRPGGVRTPGAEAADAQCDQIGQPVQEVGQPAGQVEDEDQQSESAGQELDGRRRPEHGGQSDQVDGPQHGTVDGSQAPDHHHRHHQHRVGGIEGGGGDPLGGEGEAHSGVAGDEAGQGEGQELAAAEGDAQGARHGLVVPHRHEPPGHPTVTPHPDHQDRQDQDPQ